jgi:hypothetical protein
VCATSVTKTRSAAWHTSERFSRAKEAQQETRGLAARLCDQTDCGPCQKTTWRNRKLGLTAKVGWREKCNSV